MKKHEKRMKKHEKRIKKHEKKNKKNPLKIIFCVFIIYYGVIRMSVL